RLDLVRDAAVANRGVPSLRDARGARREAPLCATDAWREGADLRTERRPRLRRRRDREAQRDSEGLPDPHEDGVPRRRRDAKPPLVRLGHGIGVRAHKPGERSWPDCPIHAPSSPPTPNPRTTRPPPTPTC